MSMTAELHRAYGTARSRRSIVACAAAAVALLASAAPSSAQSIPAGTIDSLLASAETFTQRYGPTERNAARARGMAERVYAAARASDAAAAEARAIRVMRLSFDREAERDTILALAHLEVAAAQRSGNDRLLLGAEIWLAEHLTEYGHADSAVAVVDGMRRRYEASADSAGLGIALLHLSSAEAALRPDSALAHAAQALPLLEAARDTTFLAGAAGHLVALRHEQAQRLVARGDTAAAITVLAATAPVAHRHATRWTANLDGWQVDTLIAGLHARRGQADSARAWLRTALERVRGDADRLPEVAPLLERLVGGGDVPGDTLVRWLRMLALMRQGGGLRFTNDTSATPAQLYQRIATRYAAGGERDSAKAYLVDAAFDALRRYDRTTAWETLQELVALHASTGAADSARWYGRMAIDIYGRLAHDHARGLESIDITTPMGAALADCRAWAAMLHNQFVLERRARGSGWDRWLADLVDALEYLPDTLRAGSSPLVPSLGTAGMEEMRRAGMLAMARHAVEQGTWFDAALQALILRDRLARGSAVLAAAGDEPLPGAVCVPFRGDVLRSSGGPLAEVPGVLPAGLHVLAYALEGDTLLAWHLPAGRGDMLWRRVLTAAERTALFATAPDARQRHEQARLLLPAGEVARLPERGSLAISLPPALAHIDAGTLQPPGWSKTLGDRFTIRRTATAAAALGDPPPW